MTTTAPCQSPTMHLSPKSQRVSFSSNEAPGTSPRSTQGEQEVRHRGRNGEEPSSCDKHGADEEDGLQQDETKGKSRLHRCCERDTSKKDTSAPDSSCWDLCCGFCSLWKVKKWKDLCSFLSVENHLEWRMHMLVAKHGDPKALLEYYTSRYASLVVFMTLLLTIEVAVLTSTSPISDCIQRTLAASPKDTWAGHVQIKNTTVNVCDFPPSEEKSERIIVMRTRCAFVCGILLVTSTLLTMTTIVATFTSWGMIGALPKRNVVYILSTPAGLMGSQFPFFLMIATLCSAFLGTIVYVIVLIPHAWAIAFLVPTLLLLIYGMALYQMLGRLILHTGAMTSDDSSKELNLPCVFQDEQDLRKWRDLTQWEGKQSKKIQEAMMKGIEQRKRLSIHGSYRHLNSRSSQDLSGEVKSTPEIQEEKIEESITARSEEMGGTAAEV